MIKISINERCKKCGICVAFCPRQVFEQVPGKVPQVVRPEDCTNCKQCELRCPDYAIEVRSEEK